MNNLPIAFTSVRAIILADEHLLAARIGNRPFNFLPGGRPEAGETLTACLLRELHEELGALDWTIVDYVGVIDHIWRDEAGLTRAIQHFYAAQAPGLTPKTTPRRCQMDDLDFEWLPLSSLAAVPLKPPSLSLRVIAWRNNGSKGWSVVDVEE